MALQSSLDIVINAVDKGVKKAFDGIRADARGFTGGMKEEFGKLNSAIEGTEKTIAGIKAFKELTKKLGDTETAYDNAKKKVDELARQMESSNKVTVAMRREMARAEKEAARLGDELAAEKKALSKLDNELEDVGVSTANLKYHEAQLNAELADGRKRLDAMKRSAEKNAGSLGGALQRGVKKARGSIEVFNRTVGNGGRAVSAFSGHIKSLIGAYAGFQATGVIKAAETSAYNLEASVAAANREFGNIGSLAEWQLTVGRLSDELKIYSDTALKNAISRTVDMTKRLGLSKEQMEEVIRRAADLGAGKVDLEQAVERVTAALRGEAESAEYLGLTLNENYVKAVYAAGDANRKAWKDLTDLEKAQVRYGVFLQQSEEMLGRAAGSADTFSGALSLVGKELDNALANSEDVASAMNALAEALRGNAGDIGRLVAGLADLVAWVIEAGVRWRWWLKTLIVPVAVIYSIDKLALAFKGLAAAFKFLTGAKITAWYTKLQVAATSLWAQTTASAMALKAGVATAAIYVSYLAGVAILEYRKMRMAWNQAEDAQGRLVENSQRLLDKYAEFKDVEIPKDLTKVAQEDVEELQHQLQGAKTYYTALKNILEQKAGKTILGVATDEALAAKKELADVKVKVSNYHNAIVALGKAMQKPAEAVKLTNEELQEMEEKAKKAYGEAKKHAEEYADKVISLEKKIRAARMSTEDKLRELGRMGLSDAEQWADRKRQAEEKLFDAKKAMARQDYELAEELARDAEGLYAGLAEEVTQSGKGGSQIVVQSLRDTKRVAMDGVSAVGAFVELLYTVQKDAAAQSRDTWLKTAEEIKKQLDFITAQRKANIQIELKNLEAAQRAIDNLTKDETKTITVITRHMSASEVAGDPSIMPSVGMSTGGGLPGYGGGDRIRAILEAGEYVIRKEAVQKYGPALFSALNNMRLQLPDMVRARLGGMIASIPLPAGPQMAFAAGGGVPAIGGGGESMTIRFQAGNVEMPLNVVGNRGVTRRMVRAFEAELVKMGLSKR